MDQTGWPEGMRSLCKDSFPGDHAKATSWEAKAHRQTRGRFQQGISRRSERLRAAVAQGRVGLRDSSELHSQDEKGSKGT